MVPCDQITPARGSSRTLWGEAMTMETTLFGGRGHPVAYIADDGENSVYLWSGHAVAYVIGESLRLERTAPWLVR